MAVAKNPLVRLYHIRDEIEGVAVTLAGLDFDGYATSYTAKRTVERALQIVSEAVKALPDELLAHHPSAEGGRIQSLGIFFGMSTIISISTNLAYRNRKAARATSDHSSYDL